MKRTKALLQKDIFPPLFKQLKRHIFDGKNYLLHSETRQRRSVSGAVHVTHQEGRLGVLRALDAQSVELPLLQAALHQTDSAAHATLDVLKRRSREALPQLVTQHLSGRRRHKQRARERESRRRVCWRRDERGDGHLKSDSSAELAWLIMAQRQSMLALDRALPMHFFTM